MAGFQKAKREKVYLKVLLSGPSGCGKSYSALRLAKGIAECCDGKIAYIGTEGSRDKYYANEFDYALLQLEDPFTPEKYIEAINEAVEAGFDVLIVDSTTHEWLYLNDIHDKMPGNSFTNWGKLKGRHHAFEEAILQAPIHVVATARGKDQWVMEDSDGKKNVPKKVGMGQQQDKDISYQYTVSFMVAQDTHIASVDKDNTHLFDGRYEILTEKDGKNLYAWANSGEIPEEKPVKKAEKKEDPMLEVANDLDSVKNDIKTETEKLIGMGIEKAEVANTIKGILGNTANYNKIEDVDKAKEVFDALVAMEGEE